MLLMLPPDAIPLTYTAAGPSLHIWLLLSCFVLHICLHSFYECFRMCITDAMSISPDNDFMPIVFTHLMVSVNPFRKSKGEKERVVWPVHIHMCIYMCTYSYLYGYTK